MATQSILRGSFSKAAPFAARFIASRRPAPSAALTRATFSPHFAVPAVRSFCSSNAVSATGEDAGSVDKKLLEVVQHEIVVAQQSIDDEKFTAGPPRDFPFSIEDNPGAQTVRLEREYDGETIRVEVSMASLVADEEDEDIDDDDDDDDEEPRPESNVPLLVTVTKEGNAPYLEFDCTSFIDEIRINGLSLKNPELKDQLAYEGPDFYDLDENLQKAFHKYLEIRGVKASTLSFLHVYMVEKDNKEYVRWLKDVKGFIEA